ncbi:hypothetical protein HJFPF1_11171 [Paramyrothecium foliicola]|nr:hypothetical protein HJFPF1_11171 [Paramyrothecium foliicola]
MEVFGSVMTAIELISKTKANLERAKRIGKTVQSLRFTLNRLMDLEDNVDPYRDRDLLVEIKELVEEATELIQDNRTSRRQAMAFFWTSSIDADVQRINSSLSVIYASLAQRVQRDRRHSSGTVGSKSPRLPPLSPPLEPQSGTARRRESIINAPTFSVPCTLSLRGANDVLVCQPFRLDRLCILDRNPTSKIRILQYETEDQNIIITHAIPYGTIPCTPNTTTAAEVSFLDNHLITVETPKDYAIFVLDPIYVFDTVTDCITFMNVARERTLVGTFRVKQITKSGATTRGGFLSKIMAHDILLARNKVVRIWVRQDEKLNALVTLTFHDRTKDRLTQWSLEDFADRPLFTNKNRGVELSREDHNEQFVFLFDSSGIDTIDLCIHCGEISGDAMKGMVLDDWVSELEKDVRNGADLRLAPLLLAIQDKIYGTCTNVIIDTDLFSDVDDAGALLLAATLPDANLLAVNINYPSSFSALAASAILAHYGRSGVPVGIQQPLTNATFFDSWYYKLGEYASKVAYHWSGGSLPWGHAQDAWDPVRLYRKVLSEADDESVTIASIGFLDNLSALLNSTGDTYTSLTGRELVAAKVSQLIIMGGGYPSGYSFNFWGSNSSLAAHVVNTWDGRMVFVGDDVGKHVLSGGLLMEHGPKDDPSGGWGTYFITGMNLATITLKPMERIDGFGTKGDETSTSSD